LIFIFVVEKLAPTSNSPPSLPNKAHSNVPVDKIAPWGLIRVNTYYYRITDYSDLMTAAG
jgi:hypothetical protein